MVFLRGREIFFDVIFTADIKIGYDYYVRKSINIRWVKLVFIRPVDL